MGCSMTSANTDEMQAVKTVRRMQRWEYTTTLVKTAGVFSGKIKTDPVDIALEEHGRQGWELVSVFQGANVSASLPGIMLVFKRPVLA